MEITLTANDGLNMDADHPTCPSNQVIKMEEFYLSYETLRCRFPPLVLNSTSLSSLPIDAVIGWQDQAQINTSTRYCLFCLTNSKIFRTLWLGDGGTAATQAFTDITNAVAIGKYPCTYDTLNGNLVIASNNSPPIIITAYNVNAAVLGGSPPTVVCVKTVNNMMFLAGRFFAATDATLSRVYWSAVSDPTTWPVGSTLDFRANDGDFITALGAIGTNLFIFKNNSIGILSTTTITVSGTVTLGPLTTLSTGIGCASPCAVDNLPDGRIIFLGTDFNLYICDGSSITNVSNREYPMSSVQSGIYAATPLAASGSSLCPFVKVYPTKHEVWVLPYPQTANNGSSGQIFIYNYSNDSWSTSTMHKIQSMGLLGPTRNTPEAGYAYRLVYGGVGAGQGNVYQAENIQDAGTAANATSILRWSIPLVKELTNFMPRSVVIPATLTSTGVTLTYGFDGTLTSKTFTLSNAITRHTIPVNYVYGTNSVRPLSFQINISSVGSKDKFYPITISDEVLN